MRLSAFQLGVNADDSNDNAYMQKKQTMGDSLVRQDFIRSPIPSTPLGSLHNMMTTKAKEILLSVFINRSKSHGTVLKRLKHFRNKGEHFTLARR